MFYADDSQLYITIDPLDQRPVLNTRQKCISEVIEWNTIRKLVCNPSKAEVIQFSSCFVKNPIHSDFSTGNARVQLADRVCNLDVTLDWELSLIILMKHAKRLCWQFDSLADWGSIWARIPLRWWSMLLLCHAWITVTVYSVVYPSEK